MLKTRSKKALVHKFAFILLAMLVLVALFFIPNASATSVSDGIDQSTVDDDGKVYVTFPAQDGPLYLVVYHETTTDNFAELSVASVSDPSSGKVEYEALDFETVHGGESVVLYFAVIPQEDYDDYIANDIAKTIERSGNNLEVKWERADESDASFILVQETITRSVNVRSITATNTTAGAQSPYAVKAGDTVTVSVQSNTADAVISGETLSGSSFSFAKSGVASNDGYYTYTSEVVVPEGSLGLNEAAALAFSFTIDGVAITQDSDLVKATPHRAVRQRMW